MWEVLGSLGCGVSRSPSTEAFTALHDAAHHYPSDHLSNHSPRSLASLQFFKHAKHISASGSLHLLFFCLEHSSPTVPPGSLCFFQDSTQMSPRLSLTF